jgi:pyruvate, water dikinase
MIKKSNYILFFICLILNSCSSHKQENSLDRLKDHNQFYLLHSSPPKSNFGEIESIKVIYDFMADKMYYFNSKEYPSHYDFALKNLDVNKEAKYFFYDQFGKSSNRFLYLVTINYHKNIDAYVFEFSSYDLVDCKGIQLMYKKLLETSYFKDKLYFHSNNTRWDNCKNIPTITSSQLYNGQNYQALNLGECYGYLKKIDVKDLESKNIALHDLVILNGIPNDLPVVSGIICTEFQSALSHINILSYNRNTPNMTLKNVLGNAQINGLCEQLVYLKVEANSYTIRKANINEAVAFWDKNDPKTTIVLEKEIDEKELIDISNKHKATIKTIGGKANNFFELVKLGNIPLPENAFAIPFYYYEKHLKDNHIDAFIQRTLADPKFKSNQEYRKNKLKQIRLLIKDAPLNKDLKALVLNKINNFKNFDAYKFRSSTNAEDVESFNGAGLYDSYSAKKNDTKKTIDNAIKKVWASLWNARAYEEREYYKINQQSIAMGVLVNRSFADENANGVVITKNLFNVNHGYTINAQYGEISTVSPKPSIICDQIIAYTFNLIDNKYTFEYLNNSNVPELKGKPVLTDDELRELADYCTIIKEHYFKNIQKSSTCSYNDFAVDIEFKIDSKVSSRKIYIKQVRIYKSKN